MGDPLDARCTVSTVDGVEESEVLITWTGPGVSTLRFNMSDRISLGSNTYLVTLYVAFLMKTDGNSPYFCIVTILEAFGSESFEIESLSGKHINVNVNYGNVKVIISGLTCVTRVYANIICDYLRENRPSSHL